MTLGKAFLLVVLLCSTSLLPGQNEKNNPEVAPGFVLPFTGTIFGLDLVDQKPSLLQVHPTEISDNTHAGSNFARSMVYAGPHATIELTGTSSAASFHTSDIVLYVKLSGDDPELLRNRVKLLRLTQTKDRRVVSDFSMNVFGGHKARRFDEIAVAKTDLIDSSWLKLVPQTPLKPGEYGIVFMPKDPNLFADAVYDFSIAGERIPKTQQ